MTEKIAVVTGAGSGIGRAIAIELAARNLTVVPTDLDLAAAEQTGLEIAKAGGAAGHARRLDVTNADQATEVAEDVAAQHGSIDVWVSNAGISKMQDFLAVTPEDLRRTLAVNLEGVFLCGQAAARVMIEAGAKGVIVNVASMAGKQGRVPYLADYVASKFGVVGLTQAMAFELARYGITVNAVCPGYVATPMQDREVVWEAALRGTDAETVRRLYIDDTPLGRLQAPQDVACAVAFLAGPDARFITGEALAVNGGAFMDLPAAADTVAESHRDYPERSRAFPARRHLGLRRKSWRARLPSLSARASGPRGSTRRSCRSGRQRRAACRRTPATALRCRPGR